MAECRDECEKKSVCGGGAKCEIGEKEGVVLKDGEGGEEGVWDVKWGGSEEDVKGRRRCGDEGDGVDLVKTVITVFWVYSKPWVGPRGNGRVGGK